LRLHTYLSEGEGEFDLSKRIIFQWKGHKVVDSAHGKERIEQRNTLTDFQLIKLFQAAIMKVDKKKVKIGEKVVFWSKALKQAFIAKVDDVKDLILLTFYPRHTKPSGANHPFQSEVVIEGQTLRVIDLDEI
jgi:hypothetical protein